MEEEEDAAFDLLNVSLGRPSRIHYSAPTRTLVDFHYSSSPSRKTDFNQRGWAEAGGGKVRTSGVLRRWKTQRRADREAGFVSVSTTGPESLSKTAPAALATQTMLSGTSHSNHRLREVPFNPVPLPRNLNTFYSKHPDMSPYRAMVQE